MAETTKQNGQTVHAQSTPENPLNVAGDYLRTQDAVHLQNWVKSRGYLDAVRDAETKAAYPGIELPKGDDMIAVDSNFKTEHHYHAPAASEPQPKPLPAWAKVGALVAALAGAGAGGALLNNALNKPEGAATIPAKPATDKSKSYQLDFWD